VLGFQVALYKSEDYDYDLYVCVDIPKIMHRINIMYSLQEKVA